MEITQTKIFKTFLAKRDRTMKDELKKIYEDTIPHSTFLDKPSVEKCMENSYNLGVNDVLEWLSKQDYLSDNIKYIIEEWENQTKL
jgi:carboxypeptidase C (cathepsin A)